MQILNVNRGSGKIGFSVILKEVEGSQPIRNTRFFAALRMTTLGQEEFCNGLNSFEFPVLSFEFLLLFFVDV
jgi:hypothetical protein